MPAMEVDIDHKDFDLTFSTEKSQRSKLTATIQTTSSHSNSSGVSLKAHSVGDEEELDGLHVLPSFDNQSMPYDSSFDLTNVRGSTYRDSLMPENGYGEHNNGERATELGNALMRMDDNYGRAYNRKSRRQSSGSRPDGLSPLLQAAREGDVVLVNALVIQPGTDILRRDPMFGQTALHFAIRGGHLNVVQALLMPHVRGSIVNVVDNRRNTALHLAAAKSRRMTRLLLECGADANLVNMRNQTPLGVHILTVTRDDPMMTEILLQHRTDVNARVDKSTTLHVALDKGLIQIATRLVRFGARLDLKDESGKTVFDKVNKAQLTTLMANVMYPPVWIPDNERVDCMECHKKFGFVGSRKHHCRMCGRVLCSICSARHVRAKMLPFSARRRGKKDQIEKATAKTRVCTMCYDICKKDEKQLSSDMRYESRAESTPPV